MQGHPTNAKQTNKNHKANAKQKNTQPKQHTTRHKAKTARPVISWSVHSHLKRIRRDDNLASPLGLVWQNKTRANNKQRKCHTAICEPGSNKSTMRKPRLPPARSLEITECEPREQHSHRLLRHNPKASNDTAMWQKESWELNTVRRGVKPDLGETIEAVTALRGNSDSSQVCFVKLQHHEDL